MRHSAQRCPRTARGNAARPDQVPLLRRIHSARSRQVPILRWAVGKRQARKAKQQWLRAVIITAGILFGMVVIYDFVFSALTGMRDLSGMTQSQVDAINFLAVARNLCDCRVHWRCRPVDLEILEVTP
jgi:hypothetical protein